MRSCLFVVILSICGALSANPYVITFVNEIKPGPGSSEWIELHAEPDIYLGDVGGWTIVTHEGTAVIDQGNIVDTFYLVVGTWNTSGVFSLGDDADTLKLYNDDGSLVDWIIWGNVDWNNWGFYSPTKFTTPPTGASASRLNIMGPSCMPMWEDQYISWYFDLTPTPGTPNDDYGNIFGIVLGPGNACLENIRVTASGEMGHQSCLSCGEGMNSGDYWLFGLGEGMYLLSAYHPEYGAYQESVYVQAGETVHRNIVFGYNRVGERVSRRKSPLELKIVRDGVVLNLHRDRPLEIELIEPTGRVLSEIHRGILSRGVHFFAFPKIRKGVYLLRVSDEGGTIRTEKILIP